jgi:hypothetical protein
MPIPPAKRLPLSDFRDTLMGYTKLKKTLNNRYGINDDGYFRGICYYNIEETVNDEILKIIPEDYRKCFKVVLMVINKQDIPPHIDSNTLVAINFYLKTAGDSITTFYDLPVNDNLNVNTKIENQTDGCILDYENLVEQYNFTAKEDEAWILNVKTPHSVKCETNGLRIAFSIQSSTVSYENACKILNLK